jgi:hypothetical protein
MLLYFINLLFLIGIFVVDSLELLALISKTL